MVRSALRRRRKPLVVAAVLVVFALALLAWTRVSSQPDQPQPRAGSSLPTTTSVAPSGPADSTGGATPTAVPNPKASIVPALPQFASINSASAPQHSVLLVVKSDAAILQVGWAVKDTHIRGKKAVNVQSPFRVLTVGRGYGALAVIGAQASPFATYITCSITVDGQLRYTHTAHGAWSVTSCLA